MSDGLDKVSEESWFVWSKHVLKQLEHDSACLNEIKRELIELRVEVARLKVKSGIWGLIGGAVPVAIAMGIWLVRQP